MKRGNGIKLVILVISLNLLSGCSGSKKETETTAKMEAETTTELKAEVTSDIGVPNPVVPVDSAEAFSKLGIRMEAPDGAETVNYAIIDENLAQIKFSMNGSTYCYRASKENTDISGVYEQFKPEVMTLPIITEQGESSAEIKTTKTGGRLAFWKSGEINYSLHTAEATTDDAIADMVTNLAENKKK